MTKQEFKILWESNDDGGGITFNDIANCAKEWGLYNYPRTCSIDMVRYKVLKTANTNDAESYNPNNYE
jgi:hypothetical protein